MATARRLLTILGYLVAIGVVLAGVLVIGEAHVRTFTIPCVVEAP